MERSREPEERARTAARARMTTIACSFATDWRVMVVRKRLGIQIEKTTMKIAQR